MSLETDVETLLQIKQELFNAIKKKGVALSNEAIFAEYPNAIEEIASGGKQTTRQFTGTNVELNKVFDVETIYDEALFEGITQQILEIENTSNGADLRITIEDNDIVKLDVTLVSKEKQTYELNTSKDLVVNAAGSYKLVYKLSGY